jgi:predicted dehydrogenase
MRPLSTLLIGCGGMGRAQARIIAGLGEYRLVAVADVDPLAAATVGEAHGCRHGADPIALMRELRPEVVAICTANDSHAALTLAAVEHGARAVHCEKPIAVHLGDARRMLAACAAAGARLVVNHQRRTGADLAAMRAAIASGALGTIRRVRVQCAGDVLSDGTHAIDSLRYLLGDVPWQRVVGQIHRRSDAAQPEKPNAGPRPGWRYGHPVEDGAMAVIDFADGVRGEVLCGDLIEPYVDYQAYEVVGTAGRLWRWGDGRPCAASSGSAAPEWDPNILIADGRPGTHAAVFDRAQWPYRPHPSAGGEWRVLPPAGDPLRDLIAASYRTLARTLADGSAHPMDGTVGFADLELATAIHASARQGRPVTPQDLPERYPLLDGGRAEAHA